ESGACDAVLFEQLQRDLAEVDSVGLREVASAIRAWMKSHPPRRLALDICGPLTAAAIGVQTMSGLRPSVTPLAADPESGPEREVGSLLLEQADLTALRQPLAAGSLYSRAADLLREADPFLAARARQALAAPEPEIDAAAAPPKPRAKGRPPGS